MCAFAVACTLRGSSIERLRPGRYRALDSYQASIGVEVSTERGDWRTLMLPTEIQHLDLISKG